MEVCGPCLHRVIHGHLREEHGLAAALQCKAVFREERHWF